MDLDDYQAPANRHFVPEQMNPNAEAPVLRMYGITQEGYSVLAHIHGFLPYFYCPTGTATPQAFHQSLEQQIRNAQTGFGKGAHKNVLSVEVVSKMNVMEYSEDGLKPFFLVRLALQRLMQPARNSIETGFQMVSGGAYSGLGTYETNVPFVLRFMIDQKLQGGGWVELERGHYKLRGEGEKSGRVELETEQHRIFIRGGAIQDLHTGRCDTGSSYGEKDFFSTHFSQLWWKIIGASRWRSLIILCTRSSPDRAGRVLDERKTLGERAGRYGYRPDADFVL